MLFWIMATQDESVPNNLPPQPSPPVNSRQPAGASLDEQASEIADKLSYVMSLLFRTVLRAWLLLYTSYPRTTVTVTFIVCTGLMVFQLVMSPNSTRQERPQPANVNQDYAKQILSL